MGKIKVVITSFILLIVISSRSYAQFDGIDFKDSTYIATFEHFFVPLKIDNGNRSLFDRDTTNYTYNWTSNGEVITPQVFLSSDAFHFRYAFPAEGTYNIALEIVNDTAGTSFYANKTISVQDPIEVPNVFTPDGDNINDLFVVKSSGNPGNKIKLSIYSRNGELIHEQIARVVYWDGKLASGQEASEGVYYYVVSTQGTPAQVKKGFFHLFRSTN